MTNPYSPNPQPMYAAPQYIQPMLVPVVTAAPTIALTVVITLLFGIFGLIPAASGSSKAKAIGQSGSKYWATFWIIFGSYVLFWILLIAGASS